MDPGTAIAVVTLSGNVASIIRKYYKDVHGAQDDINSFTHELEDLGRVMQRLQESVDGGSKLPVAASLDASIKQALLDLETLESKLVPRKRTKAMRPFGKSALIWPFAKGEVERWVARFQRLKDTANLALNIDQTFIMNDVDANVTQLKQSQEASEQERLLAKLPLAIDASFDSYHRQHEPLCIENTRVALLQQHREWGIGHARPLYWLSGMAGTGKSTIARTLAHHFHTIDTLGGSFFFSRSSGEANNAVNLVGTLARHLAKISPNLKRSVCQAISSHEDVTRQGLRNQWKELILAPLSKTQSKGRITLNFVIDALDECGSDEDIRLILQLFVEVKDLKEVDLGVFVTSRPEVAIRLGFEAIPDIIHQKLDLRDVPRLIVEHDLSVLLQREFRRISMEHKLPDWPKHRDIHSLVQQSDCLFIYATTACRYIGELDEDPEERLSELLGNGSIPGVNTAGLDLMYMQVLTSALIVGRSETKVTEACDRFKQVVGSIITLFDELSVSGLAELLGISNKRVDQSLLRLHSVLNIPKDVESSIRLLHPSFRDFLLDNRRSEERFSLDRGLKHEELAKHCLRVMSMGLKRNMGQLTTPGSPPEDARRERLNTHLPKHVQYACQYWVEHLDKANLPHKHSIVDDGDIESFFQKDFLHWLEAMSLMVKMSQAVLMIARLGGFLKPGSKSTLRAIMEDARRFILSNRGIIGKAPLQTYASALVFCPTKSLVRQLYLNQWPAWLIRPPVVEGNWGNCVQALEMDTLPAHNPSLDFSSDGKYIAATTSALSGHEIRIWQTATGAIHSSLTLKSFGYAIAAIKLLQNAILAAMFRDGTVRLFDQVTGVIYRMIERPIQEFALLPGSRNSMNDPRASFSILPTGDLAILLPNGQIWIWSWERNAWSKCSVAGMIISRMYGCLSNGLLVVFILQRDDNAKKDIGVSLLDPHTSAVRSLKPNLPYRPLALAPVVAISSLDVIAWAQREGIELHDADTGSLGMLRGQSHDPVTAITFSPDGRSLVSGGFDRTIRSWDLSTQAESLVDTSLYEVVFAAFSPDSKHLAAMSQLGDTIQLYGFPFNAEKSIREVEKANISSVRISPDGQQVAAVISGSGMINIYNTESGTLGHSLLCHSGVTAFSSDGEQLASASYDGIIRLWFLKTGASGKVLSGIPGLQKSTTITFSPNGRHLVSGDQEGKVLILDAESGVLEHIFELESAVAAITFSADCQRIACATSEPCARSIAVWDISTGNLLHEAGGLKSPGIVKAAISPNGKYLSYSLGDAAAVIYDIGLKEKLDLPDIQGRIHSLAFSRDSESLATCTIGGEIKLWGVRTAQLLGVSPVMAIAERLSFPIDGTFLESQHGHIPICRIQADSSCDSSATLTHWRYSSRDKWIMEGTRKMLWIPPTYSSDPWQTNHHAGLFAFTHSHGIAFLGFTQGEVVTELQE